MQSLVVLRAQHAEAIRIFSIRQYQPVPFLTTNPLLQISALRRGDKDNLLQQGWTRHGIATKDAGNMKYVRLNPTLEVTFNSFSTYIYSLVT